MKLNIFEFQTKLSADKNSSAEYNSWRRIQSADPKVVVPPNSCVSDCEWTEIFLSCKQNCRQIKIHRQNITADDKFNQLIQKLCYRQTAVLAQLSSPHLSASSNIGRGQTVCFASTPSYSLVIHSWFWHWIIVFIVNCTSLNSLQIRVLRPNHSITNFVSL